MPLTPKLIAVATSAAVLIAGGATAAAVNARPAPEVTAVPAALIETPQTVEVLVWADGAARRVAATEPTVASALAAADITLGEHDRVAPSMGSQLTVGDSVTVSRVTLSQETQQVTLAFGSSQVEDAKLAKGQTKVTTKGVAGLREDVVQTVTVDGQVESTQVLSQNVVREPVHQITAVGTKKPEITSRSAERTPAPKPTATPKPAAPKPATPKPSAPKPDPAPYRQAAAALGVDVRDTVVLEDSPSGIAAGTAAGARVIAVETALPVRREPGLRVVGSLGELDLADLDPRG